MSASRESDYNDSTSEDEEDQEKLKESVWSFGTSATNGIHGAIKTGGEKSDHKLSRRMPVSQHEHDGNELQTTREFRAHVAKKLGALLDSCISESGPGVLPANTMSENKDDEKGFRLFSTSTPGQWVKTPSPPPTRRPAPSSSDTDSEMEMRLREAAVSFTDILPPPVAPSGPQLPTSPAPLSAQKKREGGEQREGERGGRNPVLEEEKKKKKKKKKKSGGATGIDDDDQMEGQQITTRDSGQIETVCLSSQGETPVKKKKKKDEVIR